MTDQSTMASDAERVIGRARRAAEAGTLDLGSLIAVAERLAGEGRQEDALGLYQQWSAKPGIPHRHVGLFNMAVILGQLGRLPEAEKAYRAAIECKPDFAQGWFNLGTVLERQGRGEHALIIWQSMLDHPLVGPEKDRDMYLLVVNSMGRLMEESRQFAQSEEKLRASLAADPHQPKVIQHWFHLRQKQCKWPVMQSVEGVSSGDILKATSPLAMLSASADPGIQLATAVRFINERVNLRVPALSSKLVYPGHHRLRIGFLSSDFCMHAVSFLTVELLELLDRSQFELYGYCWSREDGSELRARVIGAFDHFHRINSLDDAGAAQLIRSHEVDILIDLQGLTSGARPDILAYRPAPRQMTYLGFPGPTGHPCVDYVIADHFLIPEEEKPYYTETPLYLPSVFQSSDRKRPVAPLPGREGAGLPAEGFIFCSFNNNYKFTPEVFDCWMRILHRVPGSWLWLLADNEWSQASMTAEAERCGVAKERLIFAPRVAPPFYLARYTAADLFLDAYPFNAGTTANDALWMGLPVLTRSGRTFASRMAGSLLNALDLPELITYSLAEYEERAVELACDAERYGDLRRRLSAARETSALFDMPRFVKDFGAAIRSVC